MTLFSLPKLVSEYDEMIRNWDLFRVRLNIRRLKLHKVQIKDTVIQDGSLERLNGYEYLKGGVNFITQ